MKRTFTVAEARTNLPNLLKAVEHGEQVEITRRGRPVAVVLSLSDYHRLGRTSSGFWSAYEAWRADTPPDDLGLAEDYFSNLRDRTPGRDVKL